MADKEIKEAKIVEETKETKQKDLKLSKILKTAWNLIFWACVICIFAIWIMDYVNTTSDKDPMLCLSKEEVKKDDKVVEVCNGLGYKVLTTKQGEEIVSREFGPFWIENLK